VPVVVVVVVVVVFVDKTCRVCGAVVVIVSCYVMVVANGGDVHVMSWLSLW